MGDNIEYSDGLEQADYDAYGAYLRARAAGQYVVPEGGEAPLLGWKYAIALGVYHFHRGSKPIHMRAFVERMHAACADEREAPVDPAMGSVPENSRDWSPQLQAVQKLRQERDALSTDRDLTLLRQDRDSLASLCRSLQEDRDRLQATCDKLKAAREQLEVQLAGCSVAALDGSDKVAADEGSYGWSVPYRDVRYLRLRHEAVCAAFGKVVETAHRLFPDSGVSPGYLNHEIGADALVTLLEKSRGEINSLRRVVLSRNEEIDGLREKAASSYAAVEKIANCVRKTHPGLGLSESPHPDALAQIVVHMLELRARTEEDFERVTREQREKIEALQREVVDAPIRERHLVAEWLRSLGSRPRLAGDALACLLEEKIHHGPVGARSAGRSAEVDAPQFPGPWTYIPATTSHQVVLAAECDAEPALLVLHSNAVDIRPNNDLQVDPSKLLPARVRALTEKGAAWIRSALERSGP